MLFASLSDMPSEIRIRLDAIWLTQQPMKSQNWLAVSRVENDDAKNFHVSRARRRDLSTLL